MSNITNKKAVSSIISSVLLILIAIFSVTIISISINQLIQNPQLSPETSCPNLQTNRIIQIQQACYNQENKEAQITLSRISNQKYQFNQLKFSLDSENPQTFECSNQCGTCQILQPGIQKTYYLNSNQKPESISIYADNCILETQQIDEC